MRRGCRYCFRPIPMYPVLLYQENYTWIFLFMCFPVGVTTENCMHMCEDALKQLQESSFRIFLKKSLFSSPSHTTTRTESQIRDDGLLTNFYIFLYPMTRIGREIKVFYISIKQNTTVPREADMCKQWPPTTWQGTQRFSFGMELNFSMLILYYSGSFSFTFQFSPSFLFSLCNRCPIWQPSS